jgi:hypothetical protein
MGSMPHLPWKQPIAMEQPSNTMPSSGVSIARIVEHFMVVIGKWPHIPSRRRPSALC